MSSNFELTEEADAAIPVASAANKKRVFLGTTGFLFCKDNADVITPVATIGVISWTHNIPVVVGASPYTAVIQETVKVDADTGAITVQLPDATLVTGQQLKVVSLSDAITPPVVTVDADTLFSQTINGSATKTLTTPRERITIESDGANWLVVD